MKNGANVMARNSTTHTTSAQYARKMNMGPSLATILPHSAENVKGAFQNRFYIFVV